MNQACRAFLPMLLVAFNALAKDDVQPAESLANVPMAASQQIVRPNIALRESRDRAASTNMVGTDAAERVRRAQALLDLGRQQRRDKNGALAEESLSNILASEAPEEIKRTALLELALLAQDMQQYGRAQQVFAQFIGKYPDDPSVPEILLRQGQIYRQMGATGLATAKFYAVMSTALKLKLDRLDYYQRLVLQAQTEIADTFYLEGKYDDAADYLARLLKLDHADLNKAQVRYKLVRSLSAKGRYTEAISEARLFLSSDSNAVESAEVRFMLADALRRTGRSREAMQEVLALLKAQQASAAQNPEGWTHWRQRAGNEVANELYTQGDYAGALELYSRLAQMDATPSWQIPVLYQVGLIYERLRQPEKACAAFDQVVTLPPGTATNLLAPGIMAIMDLARWRKSCIQWQTNAEQLSKTYTLSPARTNHTNLPE